MNYLKKFFFNPFSYLTLFICFLFIDLADGSSLFSPRIESIVCGLYLLLFGAFAMFLNYSDIIPNSNVQSFLYFLYYFFAYAMGSRTENILSQSTWNVLYCQISIILFFHYLYILFVFSDEK